MCSISLPPGMYRELGTEPLRRSKGSGRPIDACAIAGQRAEASRPTDRPRPDEPPPPASLPRRASWPSLAFFGVLAAPCFSAGTQFLEGQTAVIVSLQIRQKKKVATCRAVLSMTLIHISEPTRLGMISN